MRNVQKYTDYSFLKTKSVVLLSKRGEETKVNIILFTFIKGINEID